MICARFQLVEFTKPEYVKRLLCPTVFRNHRFGRKVAVYELRRNDSENLHIRRHLCGTEWENLVTMGVEERMKYCGIVFCDENFFILGGSAGEDKFTKAVINSILSTHSFCNTSNHTLSKSTSGLLVSHGSKDARETSQHAQLARRFPAGYDR